jgi:hypothetical protein
VHTNVSSVFESIVKLLTITFHVLYYFKEDSCALKCKLYEYPKPE